MKTLTEQYKILSKHFKKLPKCTEKTEGYYIPHYSTIAKTYPEAVQKVLDAIESTRPFYNYRKGEIDDKHIRETERKTKAWEGKQYLVVQSQLGHDYRGKSVQEARTMFKNNEFGLGAYEVGIICLTHPDNILKSYDDLWLDCPGDEWSYNADGVFSHSPFFGFDDGEFEFGAGDVDGAVDGYGSVSAFVPQSLDTGVFEPIADLTLDRAIEICKENGLKVIKEF